MAERRRAIGEAIVALNAAFAGEGDCRGMTEADSIHQDQHKHKTKN